MGIRKYNPTSAGRRGGSVSDFSELTRMKGKVTQIVERDNGRPYAVVQYEGGIEGKIKVRPGLQVGDEVTVRKKPEKSLLKPARKKGGRDNQGIVCTRFRG